MFASFECGVDGGEGGADGGGTAFGVVASGVALGVLVALRDVPEAATFGTFACVTLSWKS